MSVPVAQVKQDGHDGVESYQQSSSGLAAVGQTASIDMQYGWETIAGIIRIPYILRQSERICAVRIVELKLFNRFLSDLPPDICNMACVQAFLMTEAESKLFNKINTMCCDSQFKMFTVNDAVVRVSEVHKSYQFLEFCYNKINGCCTFNDRCGFIRIGKGSVVPYTVRDNQKMVPLFYFGGETDNLKLKADYLSGWDLSYLKFCCMAHGIRRELFACQTIAVVNLNDIKRCYPLGTAFDDHFPNKSMYAQLAAKQGNPSPKSVIHQTGGVRSSVLQPANNQRHQVLKPHNGNMQAAKRPQPKQAVQSRQVLQPANATTTDKDQQESGPVRRSVLQPANNQRHQAKPSQAKRPQPKQAVQSRQVLQPANDQQESNRAVSVIMFVQSPTNPPLQESWLHSVVPLQEQLTNNQAESDIQILDWSSADEEELFGQQANQPAVRSSPDSTAHQEQITILSNVKVAKPLRDDQIRYMMKAGASISPVIAASPVPYSTPARSPGFSPSPVSRLPSPSPSSPPGHTPRARSPLFSPSPVSHCSRHRRSPLFSRSPSSSGSEAESHRSRSPALPPMPVTPQPQPALQGRVTKKACYNITCCLYGREFKNQRQKFDETKIVVQGNNANSVVSDLWQKVSTYVDREVLITMSKDDAGKVVVKATWAKNLPVLDDASRFVEITLSGGNRRVTYKPIHIVQNPGLLDKIRSAQTVDIIVYKYSSNVSNNTVHKAVVAQLFEKPGGKDRAGAASNQRLCEIQERLEEIHAHKYDAQNIHFTLWAMAIEKTAPKNPVDFEQCLHNPAPADLLHFFPVRETNHERALMREYKLAQNVNNAYGNFIQLDKNSFDRTQAALRCLNDSFEQAKRNREMLEATYHSRASLIEASVVDLQEAKKETEEGKRLAKAVRTLKDFDHPDVHEKERAKENTNRHRDSTRRTKGRRRERLRSV